MTYWLVPFAQETVCEVWPKLVGRSESPQNPSRLNDDEPGSSARGRKKGRGSQGPTAPRATRGQPAIPPKQSSLPCPQLDKRDLSGSGFVSTTQIWRPWRKSPCNRVQEQQPTSWLTCTETALKYYVHRLEAPVPGLPRGASAPLFWHLDAIHTILPKNRTELYKPAGAGPGSVSEVRDSWSQSHEFKPHTGGQRLPNK